VAFLAKFRRGDGTFEPTLRAAIEAEGLVLLEEGLTGRVRYNNFRAPGRRHHGKVVPERLALAISDARFVAYCRSGSVKLIDAPFANPRLGLLEMTAADETLVIRIDYDRAGLSKISGQITIEAETANAANICEHFQARVAAGSSSSQLRP
jgi:hypothetical protein